MESCTRKKFNPTNIASGKKSLGFDWRFAFRTFFFQFLQCYSKHAFLKHCQCFARKFPTRASFSVYFCPFCSFETAKRIHESGFEQLNLRLGDQTLRIDYSALWLTPCSWGLAPGSSAIALLTFDLDRESSDQLHRWCLYKCKFKLKCLEKCTINFLIILCQSSIHIFRVTPAWRWQCFCYHTQTPISNLYLSKSS